MRRRVAHSYTSLPLFFSLYVLYTFTPTRTPPQALGDFATELSGAARDIAASGRKFGVAGYDTHDANDPGHGPGGMYGSSWSKLGAPLDVARLLGEVGEVALLIRDPKRKTVSS